MCVLFAHPPWWLGLKWVGIPTRWNLEYRLCLCATCLWISAALAHSILFVSVVISHTSYYIFFTDTIFFLLYILYNKRHCALLTLHLQSRGFSCSRLYNKRSTSGNVVFQKSTLKGTVSRDFWPSFFINRLHLGPWLTC